MNQYELYTLCLLILSIFWCFLSAITMIKFQKLSIKYKNLAKRIETNTYSEV